MRWQLSSLLRLKRCGYWTFADALYKAGAEADEAEISHGFSAKREFQKFN